jgi:hypothetical protein
MMRMQLYSLCFAFGGRPGARVHVSDGGHALNSTWSQELVESLVQAR